MSTSTAQFDPALNRQRAEKIHMLGQPMHGTETALAAAEARLRALVRIDPDHRLSYLMSDSWGFNREHIRQVNRVVDKFLDTVTSGSPKSNAIACAGPWTTPKCPIGS